MKPVDLEDILANIGAHQQQLSIFRLESTSLKSSRKAGPLLSKLLQSNPGLSTLSLKNSDLSGSQMGIILCLAPRLPGRITLDLSGVFLTKEANEALQAISEKPGNIQDIKLDGTNLEQRESERIIKVLEKSVLKVETPVKGQVTEGGPAEHKVPRTAGVLDHGLAVLGGLELSAEQPLQAVEVHR